MRHRPQRVTDSFRNAVSSAVTRTTLWFAEGCVESLININEAIQDAEEEENISLSKDIHDLLIDLGIRKEQQSNKDLDL